MQQTKTWKSITPFSLKMLGPMTLVSAVINALMLVVPIYSLQVFDRVLSSRSFDTLALLTCIAIFLLISQAILDALRQKYTQKNALIFESESTQLLYSSGVDTRQEISRYTFNDIAEVRSLLMAPSYFVIFDLPWTPLFLFVMFMLHPIIGLVGLVAVLAILCVAILSYQLKKKHFDNAHMTQVATNRKVDEIVIKQDTILSQQSGAGLRDLFLPVLAEKLWFRNKLDQTAINLTSTTKLVRMILQLSIMGIGAALVINNSMSAGGMIAGSILMARALQPIEQLTSGLQGWKTGLAANERLKEVFLHSSTSPRRTTLPKVTGQLLFDSVSWAPAHHQGEALLKQIKLRLDSGNRVAIIGPSGSGKTTICQLIAGIHSPTVGRVCIDYLNVTHWDPEQFKHTVGYLPQNIQFLHGTIKQNIAHFDPEVTDERIVNAAIRAGIHQNILTMPNSYETIIGDSGHTLSGGQAQKLALARALCFEPKVLVLDEPNSHMDKEGEGFLIHVLTSCPENEVSVVMVTHQPHLLRHVDWVVEINNGQIAKVAEASKVLRSMINIETETKKEASNV